MTRKIVKRKNGQTSTTKRELTETEKKGQEALKRVREQMLERQGGETRNKETKPSEVTLNPSLAPQKATSSYIVKPEGVAEGGSSRLEGNGETFNMTEKQAQLPQTPQMHTTKPTLKKKEKFEDTHKRMTTYFSEENHKKLKEVRTDYGIPITGTINKALEEYFNKYNL